MLCASTNRTKPLLGCSCQKVWKGNTDTAVTDLRIFYLRNMLELQDVPSPKVILLGCLMKNHPSDFPRWIMRTQVPSKNNLRPAFLQVLRSKDGLWRGPSSLGEWVSNYVITVITIGYDTQIGKFRWGYKSTYN